VWMRGEVRMWAGTTRQCKVFDWDTSDTLDWEDIPMAHRVGYSLELALDTYRWAA
jgi:hypothetical protein